MKSRSPYMKIDIGNAFAYIVPPLRGGTKGGVVCKETGKRRDCGAEPVRRSGSFEIQLEQRGNQVKTEEEPDYIRSTTTGMALRHCDGSSAALFVCLHTQVNRSSFRNQRFLQ